MRYIFLYIYIILFITPSYSQNNNTEKLKEIKNTTIQPFNKICYQNITRNKILIWGGPKESTGFFIDKNFILTAAHNVHSQFLSNIKEINIKIGRHGNNQIHETITISGKENVKKNIKTPKEYGLRKFLKKRREWDFAIIYIPDSLLPNNFNWNNEFILPEKALKEEVNIEVAGYPADYSKGFDGSKMFYQKGEIKQFNKYYTHNFKTAGGNSGSPIWTNKNNNNIILAIHTFSGSGTLIDDEDIAIIKKWMNELRNNN